MVIGGSLWFGFVWRLMPHGEDTARRLNVVLRSIWDLSCLLGSCVVFEVLRI